MLCHIMDMVSHFTKMVIFKHKYMNKLKIRNNVNINHLCGKHVS
jgi:hypothetical protein